jgi:hypothetical protein
MTPTEQISNLLKASILQVARRRLIDKFYKDDQESKQRYYFPTLEGLEAILIPAVALEETSWAILVSNFSQLPSLVSQDIEYALKLNKPSKKQQQGAPYFAAGRRASTKYYWISECGAFTLSTLINVLTLSKLNSKAPPSFDSALLRRIITRCVSDLLDCAVAGGGWTWSKGGKTADPWATWSVVETFADYLAYSDEFDIRLPEIRRVTNALDNTREYLRAQLDWHARDTIAGVWYQTVYSKRHMKTKEQVKRAYSFVHTVISSSLLGLQEEGHFRELATLLFKSVEEVKVKNVENLAKVASKDEKIDDYSYNPTLLRALTAIYVQLDENGREDLKLRLRASPLSYIKDQFDILMRDYIVTGEWAGLWGYHRKYEIYYTERAIEALVSLSEFLQVWKKRTPSWQIPQIKKSSISDLQADLEAALAGFKIKS